MKKCSGEAFRLVNLEFIDPSDILSGKGSFFNGGRWNAPKTFRAVYASTTVATAAEEANSIANRYGLTAAVLRPRLHVAIRYELERVVDFTDPVVCTAFEVTPEELRADDWRMAQASGCESLTQALGRVAFDHGAECLLVGSARVANGINVVCFPESLGPHNMIQIVGEDEIRKHMR